VVDLKGESTLSYFMDGHMIRVEIADDSPFKQVCKDYWELNKDRKFVYTVKQVAQQNQVSEIGLNSLVKAHCLVYSTIIFCSNCQKPYALGNRTDFNSIAKNQDKVWECASCEAERNAKTKASYPTVD